MFVSVNSGRCINCMLNVQSHRSVNGFVYVCITAICIRRQCCWLLRTCYNIAMYMYVASVA